MKELAYRLLEARKNCGFSQQQAAESLHIPLQMIEEWEYGSEIPETR